MGREYSLAGDVKVEIPTKPMHLTPLFFVLMFVTCASASLLGATLISLTTAISKTSYGAAMSAAICGVAFFHYITILSIRKEQWKKEQDEHEKHHSDPTNKKWPNMERSYKDYMASLLRHSDWLVTLPLLSMKLLALARTSTAGTLPETFTGDFTYTLVALLAFGTVLLSLINLAAFDDWHIPSPEYAMLRVLLFAGSVCMMAFLFVIVLLTAEETGADHISEVYAFLLAWVGYPVAYLLLITGLLPYWFIDCLFAPLDIFCKAIFALWVVQKAFY